MWSKSGNLFFVLSALGLVSICCATTTNYVLWDDQKGTSSYNCDGHVTDAICCQDSLCDYKDEKQCGSGKAKTFCEWKDGKCTAWRDAKNNVCCQSKPMAGCADLMKGRCPSGYQVPENCCSEEGKKWSKMFYGMKPGKVCCNAPCQELSNKQCPLPKYCKTHVAARSYDSKIHSTEVGINPLYLDHSYKPGKHYADVYATSVDNQKKYDDYKTQEITVDDIVDMLIKAMDNDGDIVKTDETLYSGPIGRFSSYKIPYVDNYIDPKLYFKHVLDPMRHFSGYEYYQPSYEPSYGYGGYGQGYGYGQSHGGYGGYGSSYGSHTSYGW